MGFSGPIFIGFLGLIVGMIGCFKAARVDVDNDAALNYIMLCLLLSIFIVLGLIFNIFAVFF